MTFDLEEFKIWRRRHADADIIATNGCFDVLHIGHVRLLKFIHQKFQHEDCEFVIGLNSDLSIRNLKGDKRPIFNQYERAEMLESLYFVDMVVVFTSRLATDFLKIAKPRWWIKGDDYSMSTLNASEKKVVENGGGKVLIVPHQSRWSTTKLLKLRDDNGRV